MIFMDFFRRLKRKNIAFTGALCVGFLCLTACSTPNRMTHLRDTLRTFNQQIRWGMWPAASAHVSDEKREKWLTRRIANAQNLKLSDVRLVRVVSDGPRATKAKVMISITWYRSSDMKVQSANWLQTWHHSRIGWRLVDEEKQIAAKPAPSKPPSDGAEKAVNWP